MTPTASPIAGPTGIPVGEVIFRGGTIVTVDDQHTIATGDLACRDGRIVQIGGSYLPTSSNYQILDCTDMIVMPGLIQAHTHLCQTLARGRADDLELLDWLRNVVWPYEAKLDPAAMTAAAELATAELLLGGTTAILDMGTVHHTEALFEVAERSGLRATIGKAMMDAVDPQIPAGLRESTEASLAESERLIARWHGAAQGRLRYAYAPRFALSCSEELLREVGKRSAHTGIGIHTHASENHGEIELVRRLFGKDNLVHLAELGLLGPRTGIAHCIHLSAAERALLRDTRTVVLHCPSSNLKLASGICELPELLELGIAVGIGADGAPCNNNLDGFLELRLAALLHKPRRGPKAVAAATAVALATRGGAQALGLGDELGSLEIGKRADVIALDVATAHVVPAESPYSIIAYAARSSDVRHVVIQGAVVVRDRTLLTLDHRAVLRAARVAARRLFSAALR
jgi:5-methylthioadenosine/S-adenosylhomocysteine deaminase